MSVKPQKSAYGPYSPERVIDQKFKEMLLFVCDRCKIFLNIDLDSHMNSPLYIKYIHTYEHKQRFISHIHFPTFI